MANLAKTISTLQDSVTTNGDGEILGIRVEMNTANVEITSTSTSANVNFEARTATNTWHPINGVNLQNFSVLTTAPAVSGVYQLDLTGFIAIRARISDMTNGEVSIIARVVS